jgi:uncharacterized protein YcsI (UPF0317 family)
MEECRNRRVVVRLSALRRWPHWGEIDLVNRLGDGTGTVPMTGIVASATERGTPTHPGAVSPAQARAMFRAGLVTPTAGWCTGYVQANLIAVTKHLAYDMLLFGQRNPRPCPVLDVTEPGDPRPMLLAPDADLRTDLPSYRVYEEGELVGEVADASAFWRDDLVGFLLGCSFTFEGALKRAGVPVRHIEQGCNVPMYVTDIACRSSGPLAGPMVVSMRPVPAKLLPLVFELTGRYPGMHGSPVHWGDPSGLGIRNLDRPDFGDRVEIRSGEVPVFWACGVTPQVVVATSRISFAITHSPGCMFLSDQLEGQYDVTSTADFVAPGKA